MRIKPTKSERKNYFAYVFDQLCATNQAYMDTLTAQLAIIHETAPEFRLSTGIKPKNKVQQNKEQEK
ncbi:hypothetical protein FACS189450_00930 [Spirochaetia bacterium]|nr:hypothetical protein FACS1894163_03610 [Spirochaetia bacterium]GHU68979.1 hypothetical protein FACS189450_00930 [Spirochaetia bacterium]GHV51821.1 hypothetical protein AGMMS49579_07970 [Spirochaetia bacterium]